VLLTDEITDYWPSPISYFKIAVMLQPERTLEQRLSLGLGPMFCLVPRRLT